MKHNTESRQWCSIFSKYSIITIILLGVFLLSGVFTSVQVSAHTTKSQAPLHIQQHTVPDVSTGTKLWSHQTGSTPVTPLAASIIANGVVYNLMPNGYLYALDASTGNPLWNYQFGTGSLQFSPAVASGVVYYGPSNSNTFYAFNASDGAILWQVPYNNGITSSPTVANGAVFFPVVNGFDALNANTGAMLWSCPCGSNESSAAVVNGVVYIETTTNNVDYVDALNASTGTQLWQVQLGTSTNTAGDFGTPVVSNGVIYVSAMDNYLYALSINGGSILWKHPLSTNSGSPMESPAVTDGVVYVVNNAYTPSYMYALNASDGSPLWTYQPNSAGDLTSLAVDQGVIYVGLYGGSSSGMYALNMNTGLPLWSYPLNAYVSGPAASNGDAYFGATDGNIYAVTAPSPSGPQGTERLGGSNPSELGVCTRCAGDPVDTYSGNFSHTWTDFSIPGRGIPLLFSRTYNAQAAGQQGPFGYGWTDSYNLALSSDSSGNVTIQQEDGSTVTFAPNGSNGYSAPPRVLATLVKNSDGSYTFIRANQSQYLFNSNGQPVQEIDRNGYSTHLTYNVGNQLTGITDPAGRSLTLNYNSSGLVAQISDPDNRSVSFQYDTNNNLSATTNVNGGVTHFTYDSNHLLLTITDPNGGVTTNIYDSSARVTSQTDSLGHKTTFSYGTNSTTITDPNGNVTLDKYQNALLTSETKGYGTAQAATWSYTYDPLSLGQTSIKDPNGHTWSKTWDANGNLLSSTDSLKRTTTYTYDVYNDLTSVTDPLGVTTTYTYDAHGNLLSISTPLTGTKKTQAQTTSFTYGDSSHPGDVTAMTDADGKTWNYSYDANGDRTSSSDPLGDKTTFQYNSIGWLTAQTTPKGNTTSYTYDAFGDVTQATDPLGHTTTNQYDANRNLIKVTDAAGHITQSSYDADNELLKVTRADGSTLSYSYDGDGNRTSYTDGLGNKTIYAYTNPAFPNSVTATTDPLGHTTSYGYDSAGNLTSLTNASSQVTTYSYDAANELTKISYSDGKTPTVSYTYDKDGQRVSMTDGTGKTTYSYNSLHQLTKSTNGAGSTVSYGYDLKGQLTSLTYPGAHKVTHTYDAAGRLTTVKDWLGHKTSFSYDADSNLTGETYPNGVKAKLQYDKNDQLLSIADSLKATTFLSFTYTRNTLSLLASLQTQGTSQGNETYGYTSLNQLSAVNQPTYQYDAADNLTHAGNATLSYNAGNELTSLTNSTGTTSFSYNSQGNRAQATAPGNAITTYSYDQANRLTGYSNGSTSAQYSYNGDGLRMSKTVNSTSEAFTWDIAEGLPLLLQDGTTAYVYGPNGLPLEQITGSTVYYYHQDQLGSTRALTNATGTVIATYAYDAYGNIIGTTGSVTNPLQYAGQYRDAESGLLYLRARYYDAGTGQFLTVDPLAAQTQEPYSYTMGDPINADDPGGLWTIGLCLNGSAGLWVGGEVEGCIVFDKNGASLTGTGGGGGQTPYAGGSIGIQVSNANSAADLYGRFNYAGGAIALVGGQYASGKDCQDNYVGVIEGSIGAGVPGGGANGGISYTPFVSSTLSYHAIWQLVRKSVIIF